MDSSGDHLLGMIWQNSIGNGVWSTPSLLHLSSLTSQRVHVRSCQSLCGFRSDFIDEHMNIPVSTDEKDRSGLQPLSTDPEMRALQICDALAVRGLPISEGSMLASPPERYCSHS